MERDRYIRWGVRPTNSNRNSLQIIAIGIPILFMSLFSHANMIYTPMMGATIYLFPFGILILGIIEGLILRFIFRASLIMAIVMMVVANFVSSMIGFFTYARNTLGWGQVIESLTINNVVYWSLIIYLSAFLITTLIEFPFVLLLLKKSNTIKKSVSAAVLVNVTTYILLIVYFMAFGALDLLFRIDVVSVEEMQLPQDYSIYYLSREMNEVIQCDISGKDKFPVRDLKFPELPRRLFAEVNANGEYDLYVEFSKDCRGVISSNFSLEAAIRNDDEYFVDGSISIPKLATGSKKKFRNGYSNIYDEAGTYHWFDLHIVIWSVRNAVHIEGDNIVFELGYDQICVFHQESGKIALIAKGEEPVVALKKQRETKSQTPVNELQEGDSNEPVVLLTNEEIINIFNNIEIRNNYAAVEGVFYDKGEPLVGITVVAEQENPGKYDTKLEGITDSKGAFRIEGLEPKTRYTLTPHSETWFSKSFLVSFRSGLPGTTKKFQEESSRPFQPVEVYPKENTGSEMYDLATGATRFSQTLDGVITDLKTGREWVVGPLHINHYDAEKWVSECSIAGGGWRMPTQSEVFKLFSEGTGEYNRDTLFKDGRFVWAEAVHPDSYVAYLVNFTSGPKTVRGKRASFQEFRVYGTRIPDKPGFSSSRAFEKIPNRKKTVNTLFNIFGIETTDPNRVDYHAFTDLPSQVAAAEDKRENESTNASEEITDPDQHHIKLVSEADEFNQ